MTLSYPAVKHRGPGWENKDAKSPSIRIEPIKRSEFTIRLAKHEACITPGELRICRYVCKFYAENEWKTHTILRVSLYSDNALTRPLSNSQIVIETKNGRASKANTLVL
jgi:hypothetical protein